MLSLWIVLGLTQVENVMGSMEIDIMIGQIFTYTSPVQGWCGIFNSHCLQKQDPCIKGIE